MTAPEQSSANGYDPLYAAFDSPLMRQLRQEACGEDIGQHSWVTADEFRSDIDRLSLTTSSRLLDLGCGPCGPLVFAVKSTGCVGTGLDVSPSAIGSGRARALAAGVQDRVALLEADLSLPIPFDGSSFDAAISLDVIVHLPNRKALFHEIARLLVPTGRLLLTENWMKSSKCKILKPKNPPQKCQLQISDVKVCTVFGVSSIYLRKESVPFGIHRATIPSLTKTGPACWRHGHILNQVDHAK